MDGDMTTITKPDSEGQPGQQKSFSFDHSYWSYDKSDPNYAGQQRIYEDLGVELLNHSFSGYNTCIVACKSPCHESIYDDSRCSLIQRLAKEKKQRWERKPNKHQKYIREQLTIAAA